MHRSTPVCAEFELMHIAFMFSFAADSAVAAATTFYIRCRSIDLFTPEEAAKNIGQTGQEEVVLSRW